MAISPEQWSIINAREASKQARRQENEDGPVGYNLLTSNWSLESVQEPAAKDVEFHCCTPTRTVYVTTSRGDAVRYVARPENKGLVIVPYTPGTDQERRYVLKMKKEQGRSYFDV